MLFSNETFLVLGVSFKSGLLQARRYNYSPFLFTLSHKAAGRATNQATKNLSLVISHATEARERETDQNFAVLVLSAKVRLKMRGTLLTN